LRHSRCWGRYDTTVRHHRSGDGVSHGRSGGVSQGLRWWGVRRHESDGEDDTATNEPRVIDLLF